ncbi:MAG: aldo/keto reductase [Betaproteobacteria bacterium]|nr:aldo/keto reductase [Betaproteobacteria bacterium]
MEYRRLGRAGLKVSALSFGSWITYGNQVEEKAAIELMSAARDHGVNFFDNAEVYAAGKSEELMGAALKKLNWDRLTYIVSTKFFWGLPAKFGEGVNEKNTLNRKYLMQAIDHSLRRLQLDYVDLVYCHRPDANTPLEEIVYAMHDMIVQGKALYWGTSEWSATDIMGAWHIADKHHLHKPVVEQPQYNLFHRNKVELEYARLYDELGIGTTIWSPLASGLLTGKYANGIPADSRGSLKNMGWMQEQLLDTTRNAIVGKLAGVAKELNCSTAQLAIAWCLKNPRVSSVITGASRLAQVSENMKALEIASRLTPDVMTRVVEIVGSNYD